ncbi:resistance to inhibitors of cholinesterase protein 3-like [Ylistrum balloti]|uniref:resistance to inhibitors of cholinesterase protein 3-like n=1 Tax=Ylistrum balloti TaxID=509963 RepID=UPI002905E360|nr:resistance to inhibitors of cholinesterase protein 3-like [Ylistrum balloti]
MMNPDGQTGGTPNVRLIISVIIIVGCFTVIYPRFFHPLVLKAFGMAPEPPVKHQPDFPPHRGVGGHGPGRPSPDDIKQHMRPGPHPGMRASAEMNKQKQSSGGRGGIMGMVLPMYAVGIVVYLIYTLFKVFNKQGKGDIRRRQLEEQQRRGLAYRGGVGGQYRDGVGTYPGSEPTAPLTDMYGETPEEKLANIEDVLNKAEDKNISEVQMQDLQRRLQETEAQMANILKAMNAVSNKVVESAAEDDSEPHLVKDKEKDNKSNDSSPDISSYEVIDKSKGEKSKSSSPEVETLTAGKEVNDEEKAKTDGNEEKSEGKSEEKKEEDETEIEEVLLEDKKDEEDEDGESSVRKRKTHPVSN